MWCALTGVVRCAKVYKAVDQRGFHKQSLYREGRQVRNSRQAGDGHHADRSRVADQTPKASERQPLNRRGFTCAFIPDSRL